jgi:hypothetical protein
VGDSPPAKPPDSVFTEETEEGMEEIETFDVDNVLVRFGFPSIWSSSTE